MKKAKRSASRTRECWAFLALSFVSTHASVEVTSQIAACRVAGSGLVCLESPAPASRRKQRAAVAFYFAATPKLPK